LLAQRFCCYGFTLLWGFRGGKVEKGESRKRLYLREIKGRTGIEIEVLEKWGGKSKAEI